MNHDQIIASHLAEDLLIDASMATIPAPPPPNDEGCAEALEAVLAQLDDLNKDDRLTVLRAALAHVEDS